MTIVTGLGLLLVLLGLWGMLTEKNLIKIIIGFSIIDTGVHLVIVSLGYVRGGTAPILDSGLLGSLAGGATDTAAAAAGAGAPGGELLARAADAVVDPLPSALVLTAIVIGLAVTALMLTYVVQLHRTRLSLQIDDYKELKW